MTAVSKNLYFIVLIDIFNKYNDAFHRTIKWWRKFWNFLLKRIAENWSEEFRIEKVIKKKGNKQHVKWKGYDNSFNSWIDKKEYV